MKRVTDPSILDQLNSTPSPSGLKPVQDPDLLAKLNTPEEESTITSIGKAAERGVHLGAAGLYAGAEAVLKYGQLIGKQLSEATGLPEGGGIAEPAIKFITGQKESAIERAIASTPNRESIVTDVISGLTGAPAGIAEFGMNVPYAMIKGYMDGGLEGMATEGLKRGLWGYGLGKAHQLGIGRLKTAVGMGAISGLETIAAGGNKKEAAANTITMMILGAMSGSRPEIKANELRMYLAEDAIDKGDFKSAQKYMNEVARSEPKLFRESIFKLTEKMKDSQKDIDQILFEQGKPTSEAEQALGRIKGKEIPKAKGKKVTKGEEALKKIVPTEEDVARMEEAAVDVVPEIKEEVKPVGEEEGLLRGKEEEVVTPEAVVEPTTVQPMDITKETPTIEGVSAEEIARPGVNYEVDATGKTPSFLGKKVDVGKDKASLGVLENGEIVVRTNNTGLPDQQLVNMYGDQLKGMVSKAEVKPAEAIEISETEIPEGKVDLEALARGIEEPQPTEVPSPQKTDITGAPSTPSVETLRTMGSSILKAEKPEDIEAERNKFWKFAEKEYEEGRLTDEDLDSVWGRVYEKVRGVREPVELGPKEAPVVEEKPVEVKPTESKKTFVKNLFDPEVMKKYEEPKNVTEEDYELMKLDMDLLSEELMKNEPVEAEGKLETAVEKRVEEQVEKQAKIEAGVPEELTAPVEEVPLTKKEMAVSEYLKKIYPEKDDPQISQLLKKKFPDQASVDKIYSALNEGQLQYTLEDIYGGKRAATEVRRVIAEEITAEGPKEVEVDVPPTEPVRLVSMEPIEATGILRKQKYTKDQINALVKEGKLIEEASKFVGAKPKFIISDQMKDDAISRIKEPKLYGGGPDLQYVKDLATVALHYIERKGARFTEWANDMVALKGEEIRPWLMKGWRQAIKDHRAKVDAYKAGSVLGDPSVPAKFRLVGKGPDKKKFEILNMADYGNVAASTKDVEPLIFPKRGPGEAPKKFAFTPPQYIFEQMEKNNPGTYWKSEFFDRYNAAVGAVRNAKDQIAERKDHFMKLIGKGGNDQLGVYAISKQEGGKELIEFMGRKAPEKLTPQQQGTYDYVRNMLEWAFKNLNDARVAQGLEPINYRGDYFTFWRVANKMADEGISLLKANEVEGKAIERALEEYHFNNIFLRSRGTKFPFQQRLNLMKEVDTDFLGVFDRYMDYALKHIYLSPIYTKIQDVTSNIKPSKRSPMVNLKEQAPNFSSYLLRWGDHIVGVKNPYEWGANWSPMAQMAVRKLSNNLAWYTLTYSGRSALIQPAALVPTVAQLGHYTLNGVAKVFNKNEVQRAMATSNIMKERVGKFDVALDEFMKSAGSTPIISGTAELAARAGQKMGVPVEKIEKGAQAAAKVSQVSKAVKKTAGEVGYMPLRALDAVSALITWLGAEEKAIKQLGMTPDKAKVYADDMVIRTQGSSISGHLAPIQRTAAGRGLTLFQTFVINQWEHMLRDVAGMQQGRSKAENMKKVAMFIAAATVANVVYEDILKLSSPFPSPFRAFMRAVDEERGVDAIVDPLKELAEPIPVVGGAPKYGSTPGGPIMELGHQTAKWAGQRKGPRPFEVEVGESGVKLPAELALKWLGVPGGGQMVKSLKQYKRYEEGEADLYDVLMGTYPNHRRGMVADIISGER